MLKITLSMGILGAAGVQTVPFRLLTHWPPGGHLVIDVQKVVDHGLVEVYCSSTEAQTILQCRPTVSALLKYLAVPTRRRAGLSPPTGSGTGRRLAACARTGAHGRHFQLILCLLRGPMLPAYPRLTAPAACMRRLLQRHCCSGTAACPKQHCSKTGRSDNEMMKRPTGCSSTS